MAITEREVHIKNLIALKDFCNNNGVFTLASNIEQSLDYTISSLKTDLKYDLMYEGENVYTKADMVVMLKELVLQLDEMKIIRPQHNMPKYQIDPYRHGVNDSKKKIQDKINALKEGEAEDGKAD